MLTKGYKSEQTVMLSQQIEAEIANGRDDTQASRVTEITQLTCHRQMKELGELMFDWVKRLKELGATHVLCASNLTPRGADSVAPVMVNASAAR